MASNDVIVRLKAQGQAAFVGAMKGAADSLGKVEQEGKDADKSVGGLTGSMTKSASPLKTAAKRLAAWGGAAAAAYKAGQFVKKSVGVTVDLAKTTMALQRATNLDTKSASEWAAVTQARGLDTKKFQMGLTKLSSQMEAARGGSESATKALTALGISQGTIVTGDVSGAIHQAADGFARLQNPAAKAALAQKAFGKSGRDLLPLLSNGSKGLQEQLNMADKYGATLGDKSAGEVKDMIAKQREMKLAMMGVQVSLGTALMPAILAVVGAFTKLVEILQPIIRDGTTMKILLAALTAAFIAFKVATIASTIATLGFNAAFLLIPLAVIALVAAFVIAYKKVGWFRDAVNAAASAIKTAVVAVFNWIKGHWPLLLSILGGPFVALVVLVVRKWDKIIGFVKSVPGKLAAAGRGMWDFVKEGFKSAVNWVIGAWNGLEFRIPGFDPPGPGPKFGGFTLGMPDLPTLALGGNIARAGAAIVGDAGPELVQLPTSARVTPLPAIDTAALGIGRTQTTANFWLNRRLLATAVAEDTADQRARR